MPFKSGTQLEIAFVQEVRVYSVPPPQAMKNQSHEMKPEQQVLLLFSFFVLCVTVEENQGNVVLYSVVHAF